MNSKTKNKPKAVIYFCPLSHLMLLAEAFGVYNFMLHYECFCLLSENMQFNNLCNFQNVHFTLLVQR